MDKPSEERSELLDEYSENLECGLEQPSADVDLNDAHVVARLVATLSPPQPERSFVEQLRQRIRIEGKRHHGARSESWLKRQIRRTREMVSAAGPEAEARRQWNPWIRRIAFAAVAVAALGAAAAGGANADAVGEALGLRDEKNVYTTTLFSPGFSVTLPDRWGIAVDSGDAFVPFNPGPQAAFAIYRPWAWADPANEDRAIIPPDIIAWLQANPYLEAGEPTTVTVGGIKGTQIDLASTFAAGDPLGESVKLFFLQSGALGIGLGPQKLHFSIAPGERYRFIVLEDVGKGEFAGDDLVVVAPGFRRAQQGVGPSRLIPLPMTFFDQVVRPVLDTITFERPDPIWGFRKRG